MRGRFGVERGELDSAIERHQQAASAVEGDVAGSRSADYYAHRSAIQTGDIFMYSGTSVVSKLIRSVSESRFSHCGFAAVWDGRLMVIQADSDGVEARPASQKIHGQVPECVETESAGHGNAGHGYPGKVYWYRLRDDVEGAGSRRALLMSAIDHLGLEFAKAGLIEVALATLGAKIKYMPERRAHGDAMFCSQFISSVMRDSRWPDPARNIPDHYTSPEHIVKSGLYTFGGLVHDPGAQ